MLGTDSEFVNKFYAARKYWDINVGQWTASGQAHILEADLNGTVLYSACGVTVAAQLRCEYIVID